MRIEWLPFARRRGERVLVVPDQWSGSVQQYYHFLLGYLAPLLRWSDRTRQRSVWLRDCGPMNAWMAVLDGVIDVELMTPGDALHVLAGKREPTVVLKGMDYPDSFDGPALRAFRDRMLGLLGVSPVSGPSIVVTDRQSSDPFFHRPDAEVPMSGAERRSVPNLADAAARWHDAGIDAGLGTRIVDSSGLDPRAQVLLHASARILVGQHGAGLTNMVWMPAGSTVIEIHPPLPGEAVETFSRLARALGHAYVRVPQGGVHAPVDERILGEAVLRATRGAPSVPR